MSPRHTRHHRTSSLGQARSATAGALPSPSGLRTLVIISAATGGYARDTAFSPSRTWLADGRAQPPRPRAHQPMWAWAHRCQSAPSWPIGRFVAIRNANQRPAPAECLSRVACAPRVLDAPPSDLFGWGRHPLGLRREREWPGGLCLCGCMSRRGAVVWWKYGGGCQVVDGRRGTLLRPASCCYCHWYSITTAGGYHM